MNNLTGGELLDLYVEAWTKLDAEIHYSAFGLGFPLYFSLGA